MHSRIFACFLMALPVATGSGFADCPEDAVPLHLVSAPALSPDGKSMVFEWIDDLWTAPSHGGEARRVFRHPARDFRPRFSPDGKRIVFASDRSGSSQVFSIALTGGEAVRHTHHTEGNELECLSPDGTRALVSGIRERSGYQAKRLLVVDLTSSHRERRLFDATAASAAWSPDGSRVLFCRGGESAERKAYRGSNASQIWLYHIKTRAFQCKVAGEAEARSPMWLPDGSGFYFVSNQSGTANLWLQKDAAAPLAVTTHEGEGVIAPDLSADGSTLVFCRGFEVLRFRPGIDREPVPLELWTREALPDVTSETRQVTGARSADFTNDLKQLVFAAAGDLWWIEAAGKTPVRLTETPAAEDELRFSSNGEWLYFLRDDGLAANYFRARLEHGTLRDETPVTRGMRSKRRFKPSPDGWQIAWVEGTGDVFTAMADGTNPRCVYRCWDPPTFDWSPDGRWLALAAEDRDSNRDIRLAATDGRREAVDLTRSRGFKGSPQWSPDGRWLVFTAQRDGAGGSRLWRVDFGKGGLPPDLSDEAVHQLGDHAEMVSTGDIEPIRVVWAADSKSLWFQNRIPSSEALHSVELNGSGPRTLAEQRGVPLRVASNGALLWRVAHTPEFLTKVEAFVFRFLSA
jgi:tricorn protease